MARTKSINLKVKNGIKTFLTVMAFILAFLMLLRFEVLGKAVASLVGMNYETEFKPALGTATLIVTGITLFIVAWIFVSAVPLIAAVLAVAGAVFFVAGVVGLYNNYFAPSGSEINGVE